MKYRIVIPKCLSLLFFLFSSIGPAIAQDRQALELERTRILSNLNRLNSRLQQTRVNKQNLLDDYNLLTRQLEGRNELLSNLAAELNMADEQLWQLEDSICMVETDLSKLDSAYGLFARNAFRLRQNKQNQAFIFSAASLNELVKRIQYIRTFEQYRKRQAALLQDKQQMLFQLLDMQQQKRTEKAVVLETIREQKAFMELELEQQNQLIVNIKKNEKQLLAQIQTEEQNRKKLERLIEIVINNALKKEETGAIANSGSPAEAFSNNKGKLVWPVEEGVVIRKFGKQRHPTLKSVEIVNNGIDIESSGSPSVLCVFYGRVVGVQFIPGFENTIIVRHANFYTVYSNLAEIYVERGSEVRSGMKLGSLSAKKPVLHFEIWQGKNRMNPQQWLRPETKKQY